MKTITQAVDKFYNASFSRELQQEFLGNPSVVFNKTGFTIIDTLEEGARCRYFYYSKYLCTEHCCVTLPSGETSRETLAIYDYGNLNEDAIRRLYQIQKELKSYLPEDCIYKSIKLKSGRVDLYDVGLVRNNIPNL
jgi:hypothetical protein